MPDDETEDEILVLRPRKGRSLPPADEVELEPMTPDQVQQLAAEVEAKAAEPGALWLGGAIDDDDEVELPALPAAPQVLRRPRRAVPDVVLPPPKTKTYCESCGFVDAHAPGCPGAEAEEAMEQLEIMDLEDRERAGHEPEPIIPLFRRIGASILQRLAKKIDPGA